LNAEDLDKKIERVRMPLIERVGMPLIERVGMPLIEKVWMPLIERVGKLIFWIYMTRFYYVFYSEQITLVTESINCLCIGQRLPHLQR
jgi:hypothetical protein